MQSRRGIILVVVLIVIVLLTLAVFAFSKFMSAQHRIASTSLRQTQTRLLSESGIEYLRAILFLDQWTLLELGGLYDNSELFCGHIITDGTISLSGFAAGTQTAYGLADSRHIGRFSVVAPALSEDGVLRGEFTRYGLEDESAKVNLRWILQLDLQQPGIGRMILMRFPGVNEEIADAILDWIDDSSYEPREFGAKDEYYTNLDPPYYTRNAMPDSLDELLLVRGVTPKLLYGIDWNRNGIVDLGEPSEYTLDEFDVLDGSLNLGLISYLTLDSRESIFTPCGLYYKINVNIEDLAELQTLLTERFDELGLDPSWASYIISFRQQANQASQAPNANAGGNAGLGNIIQGMLTGNTGTGTAGNAASSATNADGTLNSLLALVGGQGSPFADDPDEMIEYMPILYDHLMLSDTPLVGRININQASRTVLELLVAYEDELTEAALLAGITADMMLDTAFSAMDMLNIIDGIIELRESNPHWNWLEAPEMNYPFWPYVHGIIEDLATMQQLEPYFCTQGAVFKATVIGRFDERSPVSRKEVWLDASEGERLPRIIRIRDISDLGPGYSAELLGADEAYAR
ncbi:MAG: general secretion pathway protein GspK [Planctomycetaceae bacterium]|nr:general secretion pathway protein GspK [Planctomycetaceae bacterium]